MVAIIDADFIIWKAVAGKDVLEIEEDKRVNYCKKKIDVIINSILKDVGATSYIGYLTNGRNNFRYTINKTYKANRKEMKTPDNFHIIKTYLIAQYKFKPVFDFEADDACMITYNYFVAENIDCIVVAVDKDLIKCCEGKFYKPPSHGKPGAFYIIEKDVAKLNFWESMVAGDATDGLVGLPGKGQAWFGKNVLKVALEKQISLQEAVFYAYLDHYSLECVAIDKFYESYKCLKIIDSIVYCIDQNYDFNIPEPEPCIVKEIKEEEFNIDNLF